MIGMIIVELVAHATFECPGWLPGVEGQVAFGKQSVAPLATFECPGWLPGVEGQDRDR